MNHTARVDPTLREVLDKMAKNEMIRILEHKPDLKHLTTQRFPMTSSHLFSAKIRPLS